MKTTKYLLLAAIAAIVAACSSDEIESFFPSSELLQTNARVVLNGTSSSTLPIESDGHWTLSIDQGGESENWIVVSATEGTGKDEVEVRASTSNPYAMKERVGTIKVKSASGEIIQSVVVSQNSGDETFRVGSSSVVTVSNEGETVLVPVYCNTSWTVSGGQSWCSVKKISESEIEISVSENPTEVTREATLIFTSQRNDVVTITVIQMETYQNLQLSVTPTSQSIGFEGGACHIMVNSTVDWQLSASSDWVRPEVFSGKGTGQNQEIYIAVNENTKDVERTAVLTFQYTVRGQVLTTVCTITQDEAPTPDPEFFVASPENSTVSKDGGTVEIRIASDVHWALSVSNDWVTTSTNEGQGSGAITLTVKPNPTTESRFAVLSFVYNLNGEAHRSECFIVQEPGLQPDPWENHQPEVE